MIGIIGKILIDAAFGCCLLAGIGYFLYSRSDNKRYFHVSNWLLGAEGVCLTAAAGLLLHLILTHQFQYYYVFNYTSRSLPLKYLITAFWGGQEGSFMLWIFFTIIIGFGLMRWTRKLYRGPVLFFLTLTQAFLLSMILGIHIGGIGIGASPFRTIAEAMPNAAFIQANPSFVPADGQGLNALLQSPWMVIHPPILFLSFSLMSVPFCFGMAALWRRKYREWIKPALPWTLAANLCLLTALFLGGYWAYVTLSFGGFWAWDPVENAALIPLLLGISGIHLMLVQKKNNASQKSSIIFALLAYMGVIYETFLTRSGILGASSVHSFVDLGLYNQLLIFMAVMVVIGLGFFAYRYHDLPKPRVENKLLSREFITFSGAMILFLLGFVVAIGTSSPILGHFFTKNPTPPAISFYNSWSYPFAILAAILTVLGQFIFWKKHNAESLTRELLFPVVLAGAAALVIIITVHITQWFPMGLLFAGCFAIAGNAFIMVRLVRKNPKLIGGAFSHVGFGILLLGILGSTLYNSQLLDRSTHRYNTAVGQGMLTDNEGNLIRQKASFMQLKLNVPKIVNHQYIFTYEGYTLQNQDRSGQQQYRIHVEPLHGSGGGFYLYPQVYPLSRVSPDGKINWSADPDIHMSLTSDIYLYVAGSSFVEHKNKQIAKRKKQHKLGQQVSTITIADSSDSKKSRKVILTKGQTVTIGGFKVKLTSFEKTKPDNLPGTPIVAVRATLHVKAPASNDTLNLHPLFAVYEHQGRLQHYSPPQQLKTRDVSFQFAGINPQTGEVTLRVNGVDETPGNPWILVIAQDKPFISLVWIGTLIMMGGFGISVFRHSSRERGRRGG